MVKAYLLGVDIGTYSSKGVLVDAETGDVVAAHVIEHGLSMPKPGWVEHDPDQIWWGEFVSICRELLAESGIDPKHIKGVGVSGIGPCVLPIDAQGNALRQGILYGIDTRAFDEIEQLEKALGREKIFQLSASHLSSSASGPKILWIKNNEPQVFAKARWFLTSHSYIIYKLTGEAVVDKYSACAFAPLMDVEKIRWLEGMGELITPVESLPNMLWSCDVAGYVTAQAARQTGLKEGTPVIAGTTDSAAEAISAGLADFGDMMMMFGSSNSFIMKTNKLVRTDNFWGLNWMEPGTYAFVGGMSTVGSLTRWFRDNLAPLEVAAQAAGGPNAYAAMAELLKETTPGARGLIALPYFEGERTPMYDPDAKGVLFGLTLKHTRADIYRALLESIGFGIRHNVDSMLAEGLRPKCILAVGGGTKNLPWMQMISDIANIQMAIPNQQIGSSYGDAFMAGVGVGLFSGLGEIRKWVHDNRQITPDPRTAEKYAPLYSIYLKLYEQTRDLMRDLSALYRE
ncbi:MAG: FGGY-family carbohydrate kinase [Pelolinea sp.]|nr:FGGY-family carbohydrate kinase [Pelolinea sp.]